MRRQCVAGVGGFDPSIRLMEDCDFNTRVMRKYGACYLDRVVLKYRIGSPSLMHNPTGSDEQFRAQQQGRQLMKQKYRQEHGLLEFYALAMYARALRLLHFSRLRSMGSENTGLRLRL
jgi:hypothetical protein